MDGLIKKRITTENTASSAKPTAATRTLGWFRL